MATDPQRGDRRRWRGHGRAIRALPATALLLTIGGCGAFAAASLIGGGSGDRATLSGPSPTDLAAQAQSFTAAAASTASPTGPAKGATRPTWMLRPATLAAIATGSAVAAAGGRRREVALTFDDGPSAFTPQVLRLLRRYRMQATFFVVGRQVAANPNWTASIAAAGHEIANHTWSHATIPNLGAADRRSEIVGTSERIRDVAGSLPTLFRPPYGAMTPATNRLTRTLGLVPVIWSIDTHDYEAPSASAIVRTVLHGVRPGSIILFHDGGGDRRRTVAALAAILPELRRRGYRAVTVTRLLNGSPPGRRGLVSRM